MPGRFGFVLIYFDLINEHWFNLHTIFLKFRTDWKLNSYNTANYEKFTTERMPFAGRTQPVRKGLIIGLPDLGAS
jgi:hypothetical protein